MAVAAAGMLHSRVDLAMAEWADLCVAFACAGGAFYFTGVASRNVKAASGVCHALSEGDYNARLIHIDEAGNLGDLMHAVNGMADYNDAFIREATATMDYVSHNRYFRRIIESGLKGMLLGGARIINAAMQGVAGKMTDFTHVAGDVDATLQGVTAEIGEMVYGLQSAAADMGKAVVSTRDLAEAAEVQSRSTSANVQAISAAAEEMSSAITEIAQQIARASEVSRRTVDNAAGGRAAMTALVAASDKIHEIVGLITDIAAKTNLLALNATIEAARVGEAGKGFAVVADEVKQLAVHTGHAVADVNKQIEGIQLLTQQAAGSFDGIDRLVGQISEATTIVAAAIEEQSAASREIAENAEKAATGTRGIAGNVAEINRSMTGVDQASRRVAEVTENLNAHSVRDVQALMEKMGVFMHKLRAIS